MIDDYNRESLVIDTDFSLTVERMIGSLSRLIARRGTHQASSAGTTRPST
ncbi:hypothetical protein [Marinobacter sp. AL4B]